MATRACTSSLLSLSASLCCCCSRVLPNIGTGIRYGGAAVGMWVYPYLGKVATYVRVRVIGLRGFQAVGRIELDIIMLYVCKVAWRSG